MSVIDALFDLVVSRLDARLIEQTAWEVAEASQSVPLVDLSETTAGMGRGELQGYVRAHIGGLVRQTASSVMKNRRLPDRLRPPIESRASTILVALVVHDLLNASGTEETQLRAA